MHTTAMENGRRFFEAYISSLESAVVVDIGAQDVNGSLKSICPPNAKYIGVDFIAGRGVDIVLDDPYRLPFEENSMDAVVSSSCFEHSEMFWVVFLEILRVLKPSGLFYLNAPSNGAFHRYPVDCWRFYPDSGNALVRWSRLNGINAQVLESYTSNPIAEDWRDYVCVFLKDERLIGQHPRRILHSFDDFTNGTLYPALDNFLNFTYRPESWLPQGDPKRKAKKGMGTRLRRMFSKNLTDS